MPAVDAIIQYGAIPATGGLVDEPSLLVQGLTITPSREEVEYKGALRQTNALMFVNPKIDFGFDAYISAYSGLGDQHPGTSVASLLNFASDIHGFDPADGVMIYKEPSRELSNSDMPRVKFTVTQYPFVTGPAVIVNP